jgi:hypothetical protein
MLHTLHTLIENLNGDIALLQFYISRNNDIGFYDMNNLLESMSIKLFGITFDYNLGNLNEITANFPAIDLADSEKKVAIQITSNATADKIRKTIKMFENKKLYEKYNTLIIFGFCNASKNTKLVPKNYEVKIMEPSDLVQKLKTMQDENKIQEIINTIRSHVDYSTIHPYDDLNCLKLLLRTIDRNAIKHSMSGEGNYKDMIKGLNEITELISKGQIDKEEKSKSIDNFNDKEIIKFMLGIRNNISEILAIINRNKRDRGECICLTSNDMKSIDEVKIKIISDTNEISKKKELDITINSY